MISKGTESAGAVKQTPDMVDIPATEISVYEALFQRRMAWIFKDEPVDEGAVRRMLDTAVWAPNHRLTEPWRFFVLGKDSEKRREAAELAFEFSNRAETLGGPKEPSGRSWKRRWWFTFSRCRGGTRKRPGRTMGRCAARCRTWRWPGWRKGWR